jgi:hypothetical protein
MQRGKWLNSLLALLVVFISFSSLTGEYENEEDLIKAANKHFSKREYTQCVELFSQLVSNHPQNPNYNYKYGTCLLFATEDKEQAIKFLKFSINKGGADSHAFFYFGRALHLNYQFAEAKVQYIKFRSAVKPKISNKIGIGAYINQCSSAEKLIDKIQQINVVFKKKVNREEFFRSYRLGSMKRNIIVKPDEFQTKQDKKAKEYSLIVHNPMNEVIYVSGYNKKDGEGGKDIFKIQKMPDGTFSKPINIGPSVNTAEDEDFPYLHPNGRVLYFASKGHNSIGGYDIFRSELDTLVNLWGDAVNVGFAVNSPDDDILYVSDMDENIAYFASSRENKLGEITVYKILPNTNKDPVVIVRGELFVQGSTINKARIVVYDQEGQEVGVYNSKQQSGAFTMTLPESKTYSLGLSLPGEDEKRVSLLVPAKSNQAIISKRLVIENGVLKIVDNSELLANSDLKKRIIAESAKLNVNQTNDIEFNTKIENKKIKTSQLLEELVELPNEVKAINESINLTASAAEELKEIKESEAKIKKQIDATYFVAQKKRIKSLLIKDEIENLSEDLVDAYSESEKEKKRVEIIQRQRELKISTTEAVSAIEFAQVKEKELRIKSKEKESAEVYLKVVKAANNSNNGTSAIAAIEKARDNLDAIQKDIRIMQEEDGSEKAFAKVDEAKRNVADKELALDILEQDIEDIFSEQKDLTDQEKSTNNKGLKEEFGLQINELGEELKRKKVERGVRKALLTEAQSKLAVLESSKNIFTEIQQESEDESLVVVSDEQRAKIQQEVALVEKQEIEEKEIFKVVSKINTIAAVNAEIEEAYKKGTVTNEQQYINELRKAKIKHQELSALQEEKELMELSLLGPGSSKEKKRIQEKIDELAIEEDLFIQDFRVYVDKAKLKEINLTDSEKNTNSEKINELIALDKTVNEIENLKEEQLNTEKTTFEAVNKKPITITKEIVLNVETATDNEIENIIINETNIKSYKFSTENNGEELETKNKEITKLKKEAITLLKKGNIAQINAEKNGRENSKIALDFKNKALDKLFLSSELEGVLIEQKFTANRNLLNKDIISDEKISTDKLKAKVNKINDDWAEALLKRDSANNAKDEIEKVKLINEAVELESKTLLNQKELLVQVEKIIVLIAIEENQIKKQETLSTDQPSVDSTNEVIATNNSLDVNAGETAPINKVITVFSEENSTVDIKESDITNSNDDPSEIQIKNGFGITSTEEFNYGPSASTKTKLAVAIKLENEAIDFYNKSEDLRKKANYNPEKEKAYNKEVSKLLKKGRKVKEEANEQFQKVNASELAFNEGEITFAIENENIIKKDSAIIIAKEANDLFKSAQLIRKSARKEKDFKLSSDLINNAYKIELEALNMQNYILNGGLDGEQEEEFDVVIKEVKKEENTYTRKADKLRREAYSEADRSKKKSLFIEARRYDLAGNTKRTKRMSEQMIANKIVFENNKKYVIISRGQSNNNRPANKAYDFEMEGDSLFYLAEMIRLRSENNIDQVTKIDQIKQSEELMVEAREAQAAAIRKYNESKLAATEPNFIAKFRTEENVNQSSTVLEDVSFVSNVRKSTTKSKELAFADKSKSRNKIKVNESLPVDQVPQGNNQDNEIAGPESLQVLKNSYEELTLSAKSIEMQELERVERIEVLKREAKINKDKSEELLSTVDLMKDQLRISETIAKANEYRNKAENQEVEAGNEEIILKNNIAEGAAMRKEADLILGNIDPKIKDEILRGNMNTSSELKKIKAFLEEKPIDIIDNRSESLAVDTAVDTNLVVNDLKVEENNLNIEVSKTSQTKIVKDNYDKLIADAESIEKQEVVRIERIKYLKAQSKLNKDKSEQLLATVDAMEDETLILQTLAKANEYRKNAEIQEVEANNEEIIFKNNISEGAAMRKEADLTLGSLTAEKKNEIIKDNQNTSPDLDKIQVFSEKENVIEPVNVIAAQNQSIIAKEKLEVAVNDSKIVEQGTNQLLDKNLLGVNILGVGSSEEQLSKEEFSVTSSKAYSSSVVIPIDSGMPKGIIYQVQVGAFRNKINPSIFDGLSPLVGEKAATGIIRYKVGYFRGFKSANMAKGRIRNLGYRDAFVVVFFDGKRITLQDALYVIENTDESEKFVYNNLVQDEVQKLKKLGILEEEGELNPNDVSSSPVFVSSKVASKINGLDNDLLKVGGVFYSVQLGIFRSPRLSVDLYGISPLLTEKLNNGLLRYSTGVYRDYSLAETKKINVRNKGIKDAFIIAYNGTKKVSTKEAKAFTAVENTNEVTSNVNVGSITFKVQVGAYRLAIVAENTPVFKDLINYDISSIELPSGLLIYMVGSFKTKAKADDFRQVVVTAGGNDCFVVAIQNGKRIPMRTALDLLNK